MSQSNHYPPPSGFSHHEDDQLRARLNQVAEKITRPDFLACQGLGNEIGFWIFDYAPEHELQVRAYLNLLPSLMARQHPDIKMAQVNLLEVLKDYLTERGFLDKAIAMQKKQRRCGTAQSATWAAAHGQVRPVPHPTLFVA